jgi:arylsulfatase A-like enzyme
MTELTRRDLMQVASGALAAPSTRRPNLLFVFSDQQASDMLGCNGNEQIITPNIDRAASQGVRFNHCISNAPVCTPFRGMLMSGQHPLYNGAVCNDYQMLPGNGNCFGEVLRDAGYRTGYIGKWHLYGGDRQRPIPPGPYRYGFDHTFLSNNCTLEFRAGRAYYWDERGRRANYDDWEPYGQTKQAAQFIDDNAERPFALFLSWHPPHNWQGINYPAPDDLLARYDAAKIKVRPSCEDTPENRRHYQGHMAMCTSLDIAFGRLMDKLRDRSLADNTIVVYTSDHGDLLFSRGSKMVKCRPEAQSARVPLIVRWPAKLKPYASDLLVGTLDLMPTLLNLMGLRAPGTCQGKDLSGSILGGESGAQDSVPLFIHIANEVNWRGIYTRRHTYSFQRPGATGGESFDTLYDRQKDPNELKNLFDAREHAALRQSLHAQTRRWMERFRDTHASYTEMARSILANPEESEGLLARPGKTGQLKGRPVDLIGRG